MNSAILEQLQNVFRKIFNNATLVITPATSAKDIAAWDSLMHISLIAAVESEFGISFSFNEVMQFENVGDMLLVIEQKVKK
jgi:acyl carrier protein